mgnify:CR=1 FL=1
MVDSRNEMLYISIRRLKNQVLRGVAQFGSAPGLGPGGRRFESCRPDHETPWSSG